MNIYVIYKFKDYDLVKSTLDEIKKKIPKNATIFMFEPENKPKIWHFRAARKIKESQMVILFDSLTGDKIDVGKHVSWELKQAEKHQKQIVIFKTDPEAQNRAWYKLDYSEKDPRKPRFKTKAMEEALGFMEEECGWQIDKKLLHKDPDQPLTEAELSRLMEQYRIMIETSEKLMERRQETVGLYTTLCTALIALIGASFAFSQFYICAIILWLSGLILVILCRNWYLSLISYDLNNSGKFVVINLLEKHLPADMFECEYRYNKINGIRSFSSREKALPTIFTIFGIALMVFSTLYFLYTLLHFLGVLPF